MDPVNPQYIENVVLIKVNYFGEGGGEHEFIALLHKIKTDLG